MTRYDKNLQNIIHYQVDSSRITSSSTKQHEIEAKHLTVSM